MPEIFISHIIKTHPWIIILIIKHLTLGLYLEHHNTLIICLSHDNYTPPSYFYALPYWLTIYLLGCFLRPHPNFQSPGLTFLSGWWGMFSVLATVLPKTCCSPKVLLRTVIVTRLSNAEQNGCPSNLCWHKVTLISSLPERRSNQISGKWGGWISAPQNQADNSG